MHDPNESAVLAWSKTIDGCKFRAFAFTGGCGRDDCEVCSRISEAVPVWAVFMNPDEDHDEWCLCMLAWAGDALLEDEDGFDGPPKSRLESVLTDELGLTDEDQIGFWQKVIALCGVEWSQLTKRPYEYALRQKAGLDEIANPNGLVSQLVKEASADQLRRVRESKTQGGMAFGTAFGALFWELVERFRHRGK